MRNGETLGDSLGIVPLQWLIRLIRPGYIGAELVFECS
jgi:hypothetical protein